jgi:hypothetical protein
MSKPVCVLQGPVFNRSGYGDLSTDIAKSILRYDKYDLIINPTKWGGCPPKTIEDSTSTEEDRALLSKFIKAPLNRQPDLFIQISIPNEFQPVGKYNIGITAGIEVDKPSGEFIEGMNRMNLGLVTSTFVKNVFQSAEYVKQHPDGRKEQLKCNKPIETCFWGANTDIYKKTTETVQSVEDIMSNIPETFAFLFVGQWTHGGVYNDRKDIGNLIKTFSNAFKNKEKQPCLLLKTSGINFSITDRNDMLKKIKEVQNSLTGKLPNVYLIHGELNDYEMNALLNHNKVKAHVSFTHGEGYGHPLLLASLSGKPVLAPMWSGHLDFLNFKYALLLDGDVKPIDPASVNQWLIKEGNWFYVNYIKAEEKMNNLFTYYGGKYLEKAEALRVENNDKFSLQAMDKHLHGLLDKYVPEFAVETKIVLPKLKKIQLPALKKSVSDNTSSSV